MEMGPPSSFDFRAHPVEIDLDNNSVNTSRTAPSPQDTVPAFHSNGSGDSYGSSYPIKLHQISTESRMRGPQQYPLGQWYTSNDGPWFPGDILDVPPQEKSKSRLLGKRNVLSPPNQYRSSQSDTISLPFGAPPSDSGYGTATRRSVGNISEYSIDVNERDQDSQSLMGLDADYHIFQSLENTQQGRLPGNVDERTDGILINPPPGPSLTESSSTMCPTCHKLVKTKSEMRKHDLQHRKPFMCKAEGCERKVGFSTPNDLDRHTNSKHPQANSGSTSRKRFRCLVPGCKSKDKIWPRLDNFRNHLKRVHQNFFMAEGAHEQMIRRGEFSEGPNPDLSQIDPRISFDSGSVGPNTTDFDIEPHAAQEISLSQGIIDSELSYQAIDGRNTSPHEGNCSPKARDQSAVKPLEASQLKDPIHQNQGSDFSALAGKGESPFMNNSHSSSQCRLIVSQKAKERQPDGHNSDVRITDAIKTALAKALTSNPAEDSTLDQASEISSMLNVETPHLHPQPAGSLPLQSHECISRLDPVTSREDLNDSQAALVLQTLRDLGILIQQDSTHSSKVLNAGSYASNRSENQRLCQTCKKFKGRPCELKKHMKRHSRPYGCTFLTCNKSFGSKNDWKRHENSQHFHQEAWRCNEAKSEGFTCAKVCYRRQTFQDHLKKEHRLSESDLQSKLEEYRIGRNCQGRYWCGFCAKLVDLKRKGLDAWNERFDHIDDHFMGRGGLPVQNICDWIPVDSNNPMEARSNSPSNLYGTVCEYTREASSESSKAGSSEDCSPKSDAAPGESPTHSPHERRECSKRGRESIDEEHERPAKHSKKDGMVVYCCQCRGLHNPRIDQQCAICEDAHRFCLNCTAEFAPEDAASR